MSLSPANVRYIKLGSGGKWAEESLRRGEIPFEYLAVPHDVCTAGDWTAVESLLAATRERTAHALQEIKDFYTLGADCLWITFANDRLYWAFAQPEVTWLGEAARGRGYRIRRTIGAWSCENSRGQSLSVRTLSTKLTQVRNYRQTICKVAESAYLLRRINAEPEPIVERANAAREALIVSVTDMISGLHPAEFEIMTDLIFSRAGWQRVSVLGETQKDADLVLVHPTTNERAFVQVKSTAAQKELDDYLERSKEWNLEHFFFVCHSPSGPLISNRHRVHIWTEKKLASTALSAGLLDWLIERSA
jgi:hypothetical protein